MHLLFCFIGFFPAGKLNIWGTKSFIRLILEDIQFLKLLTWCNLFNIETNLINFNFNIYSDEPLFDLKFS